MTQPVLALGCTAVTAAGSVWYLPALADLRAGADRPPSRRTAALACLTGWSTLAAVGLALLVATAWWVPAAVAALGGPAAGVLRIGAAVRRAGERREAARQWAQLPGLPLPAGSRGTRSVAVTAAVVPLMVTGLLLVLAGRGLPPG
ncbi:hypothetical protein ABZ690_12025 [Streptomyces sp. NPDC006967]|uniref:hypothetical protein n=1 Tax=unclassified Streptomyces TaxID=2593676 RepID=UPI0033DC5EB8